MRQLGDKPGIGIEQGLGKGHVRRALRPHPKVCGDGFVKERGVLGHDRKLAAQGCQIERAQIGAAKRDRSGHWIGHTGQKVKDGGLARARRTHQRRGLPGLGGKACTLQHRCLAIGEMHVVEGQIVPRWDD